MARRPAPEPGTAERHVFIRNLELLPLIGTYGHEKTAPQPVRINIDLAVEDTPPQEDRLESVVDYDALTRDIRALIAAGHINLAETMAERIAAISCALPGRRSSRSAGR